MLKLFFDLKYQNITLTNPGVTVASDSKNYLVAKFNTISDDWETPLSAIFVSTVDKVAYTVLVGQSANLAADECFVPWEVLRDSGEVYVSVFSGNLHTTNVAKFAVVKSGYIEGEIPPPPTPTVYEQILEELENKQDIIHLDNAVDVEFNPNGHYVLYYFDTQEIRHNIFDFEVFQELAEEKIYEILDSTLQGDPNIAPSLYVEANQNGSYSLVYRDSDDHLHTIFDFSNLPSGSSDYEDLINLPAINNHTLIGSQSAADLGLQDRLTSGTNIEINNRTISSKTGTFTYHYDNGSGTAYYPIINENVNWNFEQGYIDLAQSSSTHYWMTLGEYVTKYHPTTYYIRDAAGLNNAPVNQIVNIFADSGILPSNFQGGLLFTSKRFGNPEPKGRTQLALTLDNKLYVRHYFIDGATVGWARIGSEVVSGVVNQNGTITFTNSDGTSFTTSGTSVIGADGFSPTAAVTQTASGATVSITDKNGTTTANISNGADGNDYVLTAQDKSDIADIVLSELPTTQGVLYGNTSN